MIKELKERYGSFHDALVNELSYTYAPGGKGLKGIKTLKVSMSCITHGNRKVENIILIFDGVTKFRYLDSDKIQSLVIFEAFLIENEGGVIVDFYPIQVNGIDILAEDPNSSFVVHCKNLTYLLN